MTTVVDSNPVRHAVNARLVAGLVAMTAFVLVLVIRLWLKFEGPLPGEPWAQSHLDDIGTQQPWRDLASFFSVIGGPPVAFATGIAALWFVGREFGLRAAGFVALSCLGVAVNGVLKELSGPTPLMLAKYHVEALNYPSGHTVYAVVMFGALGWLAATRGRWDVTALLVVLIIGMGPFRVVADTHFVSDVIAGYLTGIGCLIVAALVTGVGGTSPQFSIRPSAASPG